MCPARTKESTVIAAAPDTHAYRIKSAAWLIKTPMVPLFHIRMDVGAVRIKLGGHQRVLPFA